jgi:hypothetical protein
MRVGVAAPKIVAACVRWIFPNGMLDLGITPCPRDTAPAVRRQRAIDGPSAKTHQRDEDILAPIRK